MLKHHVQAHCYVFMCLWQLSLGVKKPAHALLYVILSPVGAYFSVAGALSLWADPKYTRAWRGGTGDCKMGGWVNTYCMNAIIH